MNRLIRVRIGKGRVPPQEGKEFILGTYFEGTNGALMRLHRATVLDTPDSDPASGLLVTYQFMARIGEEITPGAVSTSYLKRYVEEAGLEEYMNIT
jgi:hypothetical protein